jgi:holo-[acyl-carrier protein] synthase
VKGVGIDLCDISRIEKVLERWGSTFEDRILTENEKKDADSRQHAIAGRWAAKEAFAKALGTGFRDFEFKEVEVVKNELGAPSIKLSGKALELFNSKGGGILHLSISHEKQMAAAVVLWE